jgi:hypothetical protein
VISDDFVSAAQATLVIPKLDRLCLTPDFLLALQKELQQLEWRFVAANMAEANELTVGIVTVPRTARHAPGNKSAFARGGTRRP